MTRPRPFALAFAGALVAASCIPPELEAGVSSTDAGAAGGPPEAGGAGGLTSGGSGGKTAGSGGSASGGVAAGSGGAASGGANLGGGGVAMSTGGGASNGGSSQADGGIASRRRVFVTSSDWNGNLVSAGGDAVGTQAADALCDGAAKQAQIGGQWIAYISGESASRLATNAIDRIPDVGPWYLVDRTTLVFDSKQSLTGAPHVPITMTESGSTIPPGDADPRAWTGTTPAAQQASERCGDWTNQATSIGRYGDIFATDTAWGSSNTVYCSNVARLYCFEQ